MNLGNKSEYALKELKHIDFSADLELTKPAKKRGFEYKL